MKNKQRKKAVSGETKQTMYTAPKSTDESRVHYTPEPAHAVASLIFGRPFVCKMVRPMLSEPLFVVSVTLALVYCGQTVGWIKMKLGMQVVLSPGHTVLDWGTEPPNFRPISVVAKWPDGSRCHLVGR